MNSPRHTHRSATVGRSSRLRADQAPRETTAERVERHRTPSCTDGRTHGRRRTDGFLMGKEETKDLPLLSSYSPFCSSPLSSSSSSPLSSYYPSPNPSSFPLLLSLLFLPSPPTLPPLTHPPLLPFLLLSLLSLLSSLALQLPADL